jgi:hypothetical protein
VVICSAQQMFTPADEDLSSKLTDVPDSSVMLRSTNRHCEHRAELTIDKIIFTQLGCIYSVFILLWCLSIE